jgi:hypothetical protein
MGRAAALLCLGSLPALAGPDTFGFGSGRDGPLDVSAAGTIVNSYAALTADAHAGDTPLVVDDASGFAAGALALILQTTGLGPGASGVQTPLDVEATGVGGWELARLANVGGSLQLTAPLLFDYAAAETQVIRIPEQTSVLIESGGSVVPQPWNGSVGGVVALFASGSLSVAGTISANGAGSRPGLAVAGGGAGCGGLDENVPDGGLKGEGLAVSVYGAAAGAGNVLNGGGGGDCACAGGGGGGNGGQGGNGGVSSDGQRPVGGLGGAALSYSLLDRLTLGGAGGAGQGPGPGGSGGAGGGAVFIRAASVSGEGSVSATGAAGQAAGGPSGGGGGGAGGSIFITASGVVACGVADVSGGLGGWSTQSPPCGPGGRILIEAVDSSGCVGTAFAGGAGLQQPGPGPVDAFGGATPQNGGVPPYVGAVTNVSTGLDGGGGGGTLGLSWVQLGCGCDSAGVTSWACLAALGASLRRRARRWGGPAGRAP